MFIPRDVYRVTSITLYRTHVFARTLIGAGKCGLGLRGSEVVVVEDRMSETTGYCLGISNLEIEKHYTLGVPW